MQTPDPFSPYETGLSELLSRIERDDPRYTDLLVYQQRLTENIAEARHYSDHPALKAGRKSSSS